MISIKTDLDKLPKSCIDCKYLAKVGGSAAVCNPLDRKILRTDNFNYTKEVYSGCPLYVDSTYGESDLCSQLMYTIHRLQRQNELLRTAYELITNNITSISTTSPHDHRKIFIQKAKDKIEGENK